MEYRHRRLVDDFPRAQLPLGNRAVNEEGCVGPSVRSELRVQRPEADRDLGVLDRRVLQDWDPVFVAREVLVADCGLDLLEVERRRDALELARPDDPFAIGRDVHAVRRLAAGHQVDNARDFLRIDDLHAVDGLELAIGDRLLGGAPVNGGDVVLVALRRGDLELTGGSLRVVPAEEHPAVRHQLAGVAQVVVERRHENLPAQRHLAGGRIDLDAGDDALVFRGVLVNPDGPIRYWTGEARRHHRVFGVRRDERRRVVAVQIGNRSKNLLGLEIPEIDAGNATVHLVDEEPAAVVLAFGFRQRGMMGVAPGQFAQHLLGVVVKAVAGRRVRRVHRDRGEMAHRRHAVHVNLSAVPTRREHVRHSSRSPGATYVLSAACAASDCTPAAARLDAGWLGVHWLAARPSSTRAATPAHTVRLNLVI